MRELTKKIIDHLRKPRVKYDPLVKIAISREALLRNLQAYQQKYPNLQFAPVLKSNAYGHGLVEVAQVLDPKKPPFFVVDSFFEALRLRRALIKSKILIIGYARPEIMLRKTLKDVSFTVISLDDLLEISAKLRIPQRLNLKVDTGMHRQGILPDQLDKAAQILKSNRNIILEGICTHFADADSPDPSFTKEQVKRWNQIVKFIRPKFEEIKYIHASNSAGSAHSAELDANVGRLGIGLYGVNPSPFDKIELRPVLRMRSVISSIKKISSNEKIGYNITFETQRPTAVATVPLGYNEGVDIRLSNKGFFQVKGQYCPIVGRVSMNISTIDVSGVADAKIGDEAVVFSGNREDKNSVENVAKLCSTIPYEIFIHLPEHLRREVI